MYKRWKWKAKHRALDSFLTLTTDRSGGYHGHKRRYYFTVFTRFSIPYVPYHEMPWVFGEFFKYTSLKFDFEDLENENLTQG